jgi:hypothetical protein
MKKTNSEADCEVQIMKQLQLFHGLLWQADDTTLIPPHLTLDRQAQGFKDLLPKNMVASLRGMGSARRYFHRLFPRQEGVHFTAILF